MDADVDNDTKAVLVEGKDSVAVSSADENTEVVTAVKADAEAVRAVEDNINV